jgi:hypothetical protein
MSESENFAARWSRLKGQSGSEQATEPVELPVEAHDDEPIAVEAQSQPDFDPASLPSIDSITIGKDIRAFLQSGVPAELTRAALRRAWTSDPSIRDFIGIAENQWDFNDPLSIPGFGLFGPGENVSGLLAQALGTLDDVADRAAKLSDLVDQAGSTAACPPSEASLSDVTLHPDVPAQASPDADGGGSAADKAARRGIEQGDGAEAKSVDPGDRRSHGGALPR